MQAVDLILSPPPTKPNFRFGEDLYMAQLEYKSSKNVGIAFSKINRSIHTIEGQLLFNLKKFNKDLVGALNTVRVQTSSSLIYLKFTQLIFILFKII